MKKRLITMIAIVLSSLTALTVMARNPVEPNDLKISPPRYKNAYITVRDYFVKLGSNVPFPLPQAGYSLDKFITFGALDAGIRCFIRRNAASEELVSQLRKGDRITLHGYVRQPRATLGKRVKIRGRVERYIFEVSKIEIGWEQ